MADITYTRRIGDRREGRRIRNLTAVSQIIPFINTKKSDTLVSFADAVDMTGLDSWILEMRANGYDRLGTLHLFVAAYVRCVSSYPSINRFISGQKIYARNGIEIVLNIERSDVSDSHTNFIKVYFDPHDTIQDVYSKINKTFEDFLAKDVTTSISEIASSLTNLPRVILRSAMGVARMLEYFDKIPRSLLITSPFHGSLSVSDYGSVGMKPTDGSISEFGNLPSAMFLGARRRSVELSDQGRPVERRYIDYAIVRDTRICDSSYFADAMAFFRQCLYNPTILQERPEKIYEDIF